MSTLQYPKLTGGLNTLVDPFAGDLSQARDCANVRMTNGLLKERSGFRMLDQEPSLIDKVMVSLVCTQNNAHRAATGVVATPWTLGPNATIRFEANVLYPMTNTVAATYRMLTLAASGGDIVVIEAEGDGTDVRINVTITDSGATSVTLNSQYRTPAEWFSALSGSVRFVRVTIEDSGTCTLYIGEVSESSAAFAGAPKFSVTDQLTVGSGSADAAQMAIYGLTIANYVMTEGETYWGLRYPCDPQENDDRIVFSAAFYEGTGTTVKDWSLYGNNMTITGAAWSTGSSRAHSFGRGLGMMTMRKRSGARYHVVAASRTADDASGNAPTGAIYVWPADRDFYPWYFGGNKGADDTTATLDGLDLLARFDFLTFQDNLYAVNGVDYSRKWNNTSDGFQYLGGTAPWAAPVHATVGGGSSNWKYGYTYYNATTGTETAMSPVTSVTNKGLTDTITTFATNDAQFTACRIYRTKTGGDVFYYVGTTTPGGAYTEVMADVDLDNQPTLAGFDPSGNSRKKRTYVPGGPVTGPSAASGGAGNVEAGNHYYAYEWYNSTTGKSSGLSQHTAYTVPGGGETVALTAIVKPQSSTEYDKIRIYRTKAGQFQFFLLTTMAVGTTYTDNTADASLTAATLYLNGLPPKCRYMAAFASRVFYAGDIDNPGRVYWSAAANGQDVPWLSFIDANPGSSVSGITAMEAYLDVSYDDGRVYRMPHPGGEDDLSLFVLLNFREFSPVGGAVGHFTAQKTPHGTVWLGQDGFYLSNGQSIQNISPAITPSFLSLNRQRGAYACSLYDDSQQVYYCWLSRGTNRLNQEAFVLDLRRTVWTIDETHADVAGVLTDGAGVKHFCGITENCVAFELRSDIYQDGDGSGTLAGAVAGATATSFTDIASRTEPVGASSGYPVWLVKSDGTIHQRWIMFTGLGLVAGQVNFYPSLAALLTGSWTVYFHGIRGRWRTMATTIDSRKDKTWGDLFITHRKETGGFLSVKYDVDDGSQADADSTVDLSSGLRGQVALGGYGMIAGRSLGIEIIKSPPAASTPFTIIDVEVDLEIANDAS